MRSFNPLLVSILSFITFVASGPLHPNTHSSRLAENPISSRQFHYPRTLIDVCANVDLSLLLNNVLGLNLGSLLGHSCLCLSAFPLDLKTDTHLEAVVNILGETKVEALLKNLVDDNGTKCTYPDHASPKCASGNVCDFTCEDGFVKSGASCVCSSPNSICNGKCGSYRNGCSSALPSAPKMTRRSITPPRDRAAARSHSRDVLVVKENVNLSSRGLIGDLLASLGITSGIDIDVGTLVDQVLNSLNIHVPISGGNQFTNLEATLNICAGSGASETLLDAINEIVDSLLSSLLGTTVNLEVDSSSSSPTNPNTVSLDLQLCGSSDDSLEGILTSVLMEVENLLNGLLTDLNIVTNCNVGGSGCPATPTMSSSKLPLPSPSTSVTVSNPSVSPSPSSTLNGISISLGGLVDSLLGLVPGILADLGLTVNYTLDTAADPTVGVSLGLNDTLSSVDGLADTVLALLGRTLDTLLGMDITIQTNSGPAASPMPSNISQGNGLVVDIDLGSILNGTLSNLDVDGILNDVSSGVSGVLASLLNLNVATNVNGGSGCGCNQSTRASA